MIKKEFWQQFQELNWFQPSMGSARALKFRLKNITIYVLPASTEISITDLQRVCGPEISYARSHFSHKGRQQEFLRGRFLLKDLLKIPNTQLISIGEHGAIKAANTPEARVSLTHKWGHNAIAVCEERCNSNGLGVDLEHIQIKPALLKKIAQEDETSILRLAHIPLEDMAAIIFSAKESAYKACYNADQRIRTWMDFKVVKAQDQTLDLVDTMTNTSLSIHYRYLEFTDSLANSLAPPLVHHRYILTLACF